MREKILAIMVGLTVIFAAGAAGAQRGAGDRPVITVRPDSNDAIDWYDPLRWRPLTPAELDASSRLVRRCTDGYVLEQRPSGTVLTPRMRCWWAER